MEGLDIPDDVAVIAPPKERDIADIQTCAGSCRKVACKSLSDKYKTAYRSWCADCIAATGHTIDDGCVPCHEAATGESYNWLQD